MNNELAILRRRQSGLGDGLDGIPGDAITGAPAMLVRVFAESAVPTATEKYFACHPLAVTGTEGEGSSPTLTADTSQKLYVAVLGSIVPVAGTNLIARQVGGRWVAEGGGTPAPAAPCGTTCVTVIGCNSRSLVGASVTLGAKSVVSIAVTNGGSGYTSAPSVIISTASGNGGSATAVLVAGVVDHIDVILGGAYSSTPGVTISGGGGSGALATATLSALTTLSSGTTTGEVATIGRTAAGSGYTSVPTVTISGDGTGATAIAVISAPILSFSVASAGSGYTTAPTATVSTATGSGGTARVLLAGTTVNTVTVTTPGSYTTSGGLPTITLATPAGHTGSGATAAAAMAMISASLSAGGTGYAVNDLLSLSGGTSSITGVLKVTAVNGTGGVITATVDTAGSYTAFPANTTPTTGGTGTGATFNLTWKILGVAVSSGGTNYSTAPTVTVGGFGGGAATAALTATTIASVTKVTGGAYSATPTVALSGGGGGTGGVVTATLDTFTVASFTLTANGSGYTTASASVTGGGGSGATASVTVNNQVCLGVPNAGNYTITASDALGRFTTGTSVTALTCTTAQAKNITLTPTSSYICFACSVPTSSYPIAKTLHYTTPAGASGTVTLSGTTWQFTETFSVVVCDPPGGTTGSIAVNWTMSTSSGGSCFHNSGAHYCVTSGSCVPCSDSFATPQTTTDPCQSAGTNAWTLPESGGAFSLVVTGVFTTNLFSGTFTYTE